MRAVEHTRYEVPEWGTGELWVRGNVVLAHDFRFGVRLGDPGVGLGERRVGAGAPPRGTASQGVEDDLAERFAAYLAGRPVSFSDVELDLEWATPFQRTVAETLRGIPRGEVVTYGELAALAGYPRAARAVGTVCATNRFAFLVPCHRVVGADGLGSYGSAGIEVKRRLLALEGVRP